MAGRGDAALSGEGVCWTPAHKDTGNRQNGWELPRERLKSMMMPDEPRLFVFNTCWQFIRTVPVLPRDEIGMDDVDTDAGDHVGAGIRSRDGRKKQVPQLLWVSLSLRNKGIWNHDRVFEGRGGANRSGDRRFGVRAGRGDRVMASEGVCWTPAHKDAGSRQNSWELLRGRLKNVVKPEGPRLFVFNTCR
jgi:hypothetical protein